jgi:hypothetical protein
MATPEVKSARQHRKSGRVRVHRDGRRLGGRHVPLVMADADRLKYDPNGSVPASPPNPVAGVGYSRGDARTGNRWGPGNMPTGHRLASATDPDPCNRRKLRGRVRSAFWREATGQQVASRLAGGLPGPITDRPERVAEIAYTSD